MTPPPARAICRSPIEEPYEVLTTGLPDNGVAGFWVGVAVRIGESGLVVHRQRQPRPSTSEMTGVVVLHSFDGGEILEYLSLTNADNGPLDGVSSWVWDAGVEDILYINQNYYEPRIRALRPGGEEVYSVDIPAQTVRKSARLIEENRRSYEALRDLDPTAVPRVIETYRSIVDIAVSWDKDVLRVTTSDGLRRGSEFTESVSWWELDTDSGQLLRRAEMSLPESGKWTVRRLAWGRDKVYVLGTDATRSSEPEILCLDLPAISGGRPSSAVPGSGDE